MANYRSHRSGPQLTSKALDVNDSGSRVAPDDPPYKKHSSSGPRVGPSPSACWLMPNCVEAALESMESWHFTPGTFNGKPVDCRVRMAIPFKFN